MLSAWILSGKRCISTCWPAIAFNSNCRRYQAFLLQGPDQRLHSDTCPPGCFHLLHVVCAADTYRKNDVLSVQESIVNHVEYTLARTRHQFDDFECYQAAAYSLRDRLIEMWNDTQTYFKYVTLQPRCISFLVQEHDVWVNSAAGTSPLY